MANLPWWGYIVVTLILTHLTIISVSGFLHRCQSHRAVWLHPIISHAFRFWLWLTTVIVTQEWVAIHRKHHATVETEQDPHSPQIAGIGNVLFGGLGLYRKEARNTETIECYGTGTPNDWIERHMYVRRRHLGIILMLLINIALFDLGIGLLIWLIQMLWIPFWAAGVINGLGHWVGYRNYELPDASHNLAPWGVFIGGEELHNNHHAFASSAKFSTRFFEIDIGWFYICLLKQFHLARVNKIPPAVTHMTGKRHCDSETLRAVIANRFDVTSRFTRQVIKKVCQEETKRLKTLKSSQQRVMRSAIKLVEQESRGLNISARSHLQIALSASPSLAISYRAKLGLQEIWNRSTNNSELLLQQLEEWCNQAESSGIEALKEFARQLRGYRLVEH